MKYSWLIAAVLALLVAAGLVGATVYVYDQAQRIDQLETTVRVHREQLETITLAALQNSESHAAAHRLYANVHAGEHRTMQDALESLYEQHATVTTLIRQLITHLDNLQ